MKKIFTLLSLCMVAMTTFAQWVSAPENGKKYYISVGSNKVGYVTANGDGEKLTSKVASQGDIEKQAWTCTKGADDKWTFTLTVEGQTWTMFTNADKRLAAGTDPGENLKAYTVLNHDDDPTAAYGAIKMLDGEEANSYVNIYGGQYLGREYGPWADGDNGSKVYFMEASEVEIPHWDYNFTIFEKGNNDSRYFIQFNTVASNFPQNGPTGLKGLTGEKLILSVDNDTLIADSLVEGDVNFRYKVWHVKSFDAATNEIVLVNEAGQYITYKQFDTPLGGGSNALYVKNEGGEWTRNGKSGGGKMTGGFMATTEPQTLYIFDSNKGSEVYSIGVSSDRTTNEFLNAWGNVGWHHFMGKWGVNDPNNALKFIPITDVLTEDQIAAMDAATGISNVKVQEKQADGYVYTLDGRMVAKSLNGLAKGLYIVNGKKVVVK